MDGDEVLDEPGTQLRARRRSRGADAHWPTWKRLFAAFGCEVVLREGPCSDDVEDFLQDGVQRRKDRMEAGRTARWG
jgi:hypothetical protein